MAQPIHKILFTSDLSKSSVKIFEQTIMLASQLGASITMLHVIEDGSSSTQNRMIHLVDREVYEKIRQESQEHAKRVLIGKERSIPVIQNAMHALCKKLSDEICTDIPNVVIDTIEVRYGNPAEIITDLSETVDLVVMGFHKRGSLLKRLMGSSGRSVIRRSNKPLLLIPLDGL